MRTARPVVGVAAGRHLVPRPWGLLPVQGISAAYPDLLASLGAAPIALPVLPVEVLAPVASLAAVDALVLAGGGDLDPATYGARAHPSTDGVDRLRDDIEIALVNAAVELGVPVLGVCRGLQILNVARGGDLHQHIGTDHVLPGGSHPLRTASGSLTRRLVGPRPQVNSLHHQAVARLGRGLRATAWADDGVIEAVELPGRDGVAALAVQWHPELEPGDLQRGLFSWLIESARCGTAELRSARP